MIMHVKSAVILCTVYFFTSVWSIGINIYQIERCMDLYEKRKTENPNKVFPRLMKEGFGIVNPEDIFLYDLDVPYYINFKKLLLAVAYNGTIHNFEVEMLTSFEVEYYVNAFYRYANELNVPGYLSRKHLLRLFKRLNMHKQLETVDLIPWSQNEGDRLANVADFLFTVMNILPEGNGLSQTEIKEFVDLYNNSQTKRGCIKPEIIKTYFNLSFGMPQDEVFKTNRPAAKELIELMIVTAERSKRDVKKEKKLTTEIIKILITGFEELDTDNDGLISDIQTKKFLYGLLIAESEVPKTMDYAGYFEIKNGETLNRTINIAELLFLYIKNK